MCTFVWLLGENRSTISIRHAGISRSVGWLKCQWARLIIGDGRVHLN